MKKIVVDCRYLGMSGIGRYIEKLLNNLDFNDFYVLWGKKELIEKYPARDYIYDSISPFNMKSMLTKARKQINKYDILFSPDFIIPYGIKIPVISMIHDCIFLDIPSINKNKIEYMLKKYLLKRCTKKSKYVLTVSNFSLKRITHFFPKNEKKYKYFYNGITDDFINYLDNHNVEKKDQIVFVGNIKKHKGLKTLLEAYQKINTNMELVIVGDGASFRNTDDDIQDLMSRLEVTFTGRVNDDDLKKIIAESRYLILPSFYEGFGLTPLEALFLGTKPIISNIEVLKEVYGNMPVKFFEVGNSDDLAKKIDENDYDFILNKEEILNKYSDKDLANNVIKLLNE